jgi:hypothetical protein
MATNERFHQLLEQAAHEAFDKKVKDINRRMPRKVMFSHGPPFMVSWPIRAGVS